jgi:hypothetical protein
MQFVGMLLSYQGENVMDQEESPSCVVATVSSDNYISLAQMKSQDVSTSQYIYIYTRKEN